eukprot:TRINITY_DN1940_c0_g1_i3.p1 TRINITY_DN1940_c0_g1~~TRINITY_DN1940_c0_g1_i3.p1  ORF type:complete len:429 (+),score=104.84 TRINITY_DN1940_c0_g1_i3:112-1398(+)
MASPLSRSASVQQQPTTQQQQPQPLSSQAHRRNQSLSSLISSFLPGRSQPAASSPTPTTTMPSPESAGSEGHSADDDYYYEDDSSSTSSLSISANTVTASTDRSESPASPPAEAAPQLQSPEITAMAQAAGKALSRISLTPGPPDPPGSTDSARRTSSMDNKRTSQSHEAKERATQAELAKKKREELMHEVLPQWKALLQVEQWQPKRHRSTLKRLLWLEVHPSVRGAVWMRLIQNELTISEELYQVTLTQRDIILGNMLGKAQSKELIATDVCSTFPQLDFFKQGSPMRDQLVEVLEAYVCYRPDFGYVTGMSHVAALFLMFLPPLESFTCFSNLYNQRMHRTFYQGVHDDMDVYFGIYDKMLHTHLPQLHAHLNHLGITPDIYFADWVPPRHERSLMFFDVPPGAEHDVQVPADRVCHPSVGRILH